MLTVACTLRSGGIYTAEWVDRVKRAVSENLTAEHRFVCLSDTDVPCERIPLTQGWPGWWSKMETFRLAGDVLALDLDIAIVGALDPLPDWPTDRFDGRSFGLHPGITACRDFYRAGQYNTSVMLIRNRQDLYGRFAASADAIMRQWRGDQEWLSEIAPEAFIWRAPPVASFRKHCRTKLGITMPPPEGTAIVAFHGRPKMPEADGWPAEYWAAQPKEIPCPSAP